MEDKKDFNKLIAQIKFADISDSLLDIIDGLDEMLQDPRYGKTAHVKKELIKLHPPSNKEEILQQAQQRFKLISDRLERYFKRIMKNKIQQELLYMKFKMEIISESKYQQRTEEFSDPYFEIIYPLFPLMDYSYYINNPSKHQRTDEEFLAEEGLLNEDAIIDGKKRRGALNMDSYQVRNEFGLITESMDGYPDVLKKSYEEYQAYVQSDDYPIDMQRQKDIHEYYKWVNESRDNMLNLEERRARWNALPGSIGRDAFDEDCGDLMAQAIFAIGVYKDE